MACKSSAIGLFQNDHAWSTSKYFGVAFSRSKDCTHRIEVSGLIDIFTDAWFAVEAPRPGLQFDATVEAGLEGIEAAGRNLQ